MRGSQALTDIPLVQVNRILKVAKPNIVVMKLLAGGHKKDTKVAQCHSVSHHYYFSRTLNQALILSSCLFVFRPYLNSTSLHTSTSL